MARKITTFLMFEGRAEEAMEFYASLFPDTHVKSLERYGPEGPGREGSVKLATMSLVGLDVMFIDSPVEHDFGFTPAISFFVDCETGAELESLFASLTEGGNVLMPLASYGFSTRFAWVADKFGVSWQINLP